MMAPASSHARPPVTPGAVAVPWDDTQAASHRAPALLTFTALTFGLSWGLAWASTLVAPAFGAVLYTLCGFGPSLAALVIVLALDGRAGFGTWLRRCLTWRLPIGWYGLAFVAPPLAMLAAAGLHVALGGALPPSPAAGHPGLVATTFGLILLIGGPFSEEFGWRGYALPGLVRRFGWRWSSVIIGVVWGLWHAPLYVIAGAPQADMPPILFLTGTIAMSVAFARLAVNTGFSVWPAIVLHWSINAWAWAIPITPQGGTLRPYLLVIGLLAIIAAVILAKPGPNRDLAGA